MKFITLIIILTAAFLSFSQEDPYKPFAQVMPEPSGGLANVYKTIAYPDIARKSGIEGKVYLLVYVNEKGSVDDVKVVKGIGAGCDEAAINAFKKANFSPGEDNGIPIKVKLTIPVTFKLK
jgi:protein TonB